MDSAFGTAAKQAIFDLHVVLEAWFNGVGPTDPGDMLRHFAPGFRIVSPAGRAMTYEVFTAALPGLRGSRAGLAMEISDVELRYFEAASALVSYVERQTQGFDTTIRLSTALLVRHVGIAHPVWVHLQETWIA